MNNILTPRIVLLLLLIAAGAASRFIPHPFNFTGIAAIALLAGAKFNNRWMAFLVPVGAMLLSDLFIGFHMATHMIAVYGSFCLTVLLGILISQKPKALNIALASVSSSVLFYLITNFSVWPGNMLYSQDLSGLIHSYIAGIPFFRNGLLGDLFYNALFFGIFYFAEMKIPAIAKTKTVTVKS